MFRAIAAYYAPAFARQTWRDGAYLLLGLALGILWFTLVMTLYAVGVSLAVVWIGLPILMVAQLMLRPVGVFERRLAMRILDIHIEQPGPLKAEPLHPEAQHPTWEHFWNKGHSLLHDGHSWRVLAWISIRAVLGPLGFVVVLATLIVDVLFVLVPFFILFGIVEIEGVGEPGVLWPWIPLSLGAFAILAPGLVWGIRGLGKIHRMLATWALGPCEDEIQEIALARASFAEEQVRIDQELHDSIGHMISMIVVQAGAGAHVFDKDPDFARKALSNIEERGRAALGELDRIIARIRGDHVETHAPLPGAQDLPALISGAREAGMSVQSQIEIESVPPALGRGVYRVVQEALTNAAKHAPGGGVHVDIAQGDGAVAVSVVNDLRGVTPDLANPGNGLASIRDRVTLMGGEATVGETSRGEFAVRAVLPLEAMLPEKPAAGCRLRTNCACLGCQIRKKVFV